MLQETIDAIHDKEDIGSQNKAFERGAKAFDEFFTLTEIHEKSLVSLLIVPTTAAHPESVARSVKQLSQQIMGDPKTYQPAEGDAPLTDTGAGTGI